MAAFSSADMELDAGAEALCPRRQGARIESSAEGRKSRRMRMVTFQKTTDHHTDSAALCEPGSFAFYLCPSGTSATGFLVLQPTACSLDNSPDYHCSSSLNGFRLGLPTAAPPSNQGEPPCPLSISRPRGAKCHPIWPF